MVIRDEADPDDAHLQVSLRDTCAVPVGYGGWSSASAGSSTDRVGPQSVLSTSGNDGIWRYVAGSPGMHFPWSRAQFRSRLAR